MDIKNNFSLLDEFSADEYAQGFIDQIEKERANLKPDKSMIEYREITVSFDELDEIPHGLFTVGETVSVLKQLICRSHHPNACLSYSQVLSQEQKTASNNWQSCLS